LDLWFLSQWWNEIERKGPKIKKALEKGGVLEIIWKINLGSWSLKMTQLRHFRFLYLKKKTLLIHMFIYVIFLFLVRERRKKGITGFWWWEKKLSFTSIPATKMSLLVSTSSSVMVIVWSFNVAWKIRLKSRKPKLTQFDFKELGYFLSIWIHNVFFMVLCVFNFWKDYSTLSIIFLLSFVYKKFI
jgi:hypothetical protein